MPRFSKQILALDGAAGATVGLLVLAFRGWLSELYAMPSALVTFMGAANLCYGAYSGTLALRASCHQAPSRRAIDVLATANLSWSVVCAGIVATTFRSASVFGLGHVVLEGLFVAGLAFAELEYVRPAAR